VNIAATASRLSFENDIGSPSEAKFVSGLEHCNCVQVCGHLHIHGKIGVLRVSGCDGGSVPCGFVPIEGKSLHSG
jgi:hypothetical protein